MYLRVHNKMSKCLWSDLIINVFIDYITEVHLLPEKLSNAVGTYSVGYPLVV